MSIQSARNQAKQLIDSLGIKKAPINIGDVAEKLGLRTVEMDLEDGISGLLITNPQMSCVVVQKKDAPSRKRFSMAHEIAHFCLKHQFEPGEHVHVDRGFLISQRNRRSATGTDLKEIEANQFAACLLMPSKLVRACVEKLKADHLHDIHISALAREFDVSEQAMTIRLTSLCLL
ncbi:MAG: ImmA/IrrE family metallo-endopeptidase [Desulfobulbaceae bacterium]|nr:ImmA/IrrE family metallo-endopeptidase [Desulfobulbaceae bacterium]